MIKSDIKESEILLERYKSKKEVLLNVIKVIDQILDGSSELVACRDNEVDYLVFRRFIGNHFKIDGEIEFLDKAEPIEFPTWQDHLFADIFGLHEKTAYVSEDFDVALKECLKHLSKKERDIIEKYYIEGLSQGSIAEEYGISRQRVHSYRSKALERLRNPSFAQYLVYGYKKLNKHHSLEQEITNRIQSFSETIEKEKEEIVKLKEWIEENAEREDEAVFELFKSFCASRGYKLEDGSVEEIKFDRDATIDSLNISSRTFNALWRNDCTTVQEALNLFTTGELRQKRGCGEKVILEVANALTEIGIDEEIIKRALSDNLAGNGFSYYKWKYGN